MVEAVQPTSLRTNGTVSVLAMGVWFDTGATSLREAGRVYAEAQGWEPGWQVSRLPPTVDSHAMARRRFNPSAVVGTRGRGEVEVQAETVGYLIPPP